MNSHMFKKHCQEGKGFGENGHLHEEDVWPLKLKMQERDRIPDGAKVQDAGYSLQVISLGRSCYIFF